MSAQFTSRNPLFFSFFGEGGWEKKERKHTSNKNKAGKQHPIGMGK